MTQRKTTQTRASEHSFKWSAIFGRKNVKRDINGRKMTQKGAKHSKKGEKGRKDTK